MFKNQRHGEILEILKEERFVSVSALSERLFASQPTIRRDLTFLEKQGYLRRSHGGAIPADERNNIPVSFRSGKHTGQKTKICRLASTLIQDGSLIFTDASTTALHIASYIKPESDVTVLTNGYLACKLFSDKGVRVFSTGGRLLSDSLAFVGECARNTVSQYNADIMFFSSSSLSNDGKISDYSEEETALRLTMAKMSKTKVFLCDETKFEKISAFNLFPLSAVDYVVTGAPLSNEMLKKYNLTLISDDGAFMYKKFC